MYSIYSPLEQYTILYFGNFCGLPITSLSVSFILILLSFLVVNHMYFSSNYVIPTNFMIINESIYFFILNLVKNNIKGKDSSNSMFPLIFTLFMFILFSNLLGLVPYFYTVTGQLAVTGTLSSLFMIGITYMGIKIHSLKFFSLFIPNGISI